MSTPENTPSPRVCQPQPTPSRALEGFACIDCSAPDRTVGLERRHPAAARLRGASEPQAGGVPLPPGEAPRRPVSSQPVMRHTERSAPTTLRLPPSAALARDQRSGVGTGPSPAAISPGRLSREGAKQVISPRAPHSHFSWADGTESKRKERAFMAGAGGRPHAPSSVG